MFIGPPTKEEKGPIKWDVSVCPSVRSLPRYLRIAWMDCLEIFRKVQSYATLERDNFSGGFLGRKGQKNVPKNYTFRIFSKKSYFLPILENMHVFRCFGQKTFWSKCAKTGMVVGQKKNQFFFIKIFHPYPVSCRGTHDTFTCLCSKYLILLIFL